MKCWRRAWENWAGGRRPATGRQRCRGRPAAPALALRGRRIASLDSARLTQPRDLLVPHAKLLSEDGIRVLAQVGARPARGAGGAVQHRQQRGQRELGAA